MKKLLLFERSLLVASLIAVSGLLFSSCSNEDLTVDEPIQNETLAKTKGNAEFHWKCPNPECRFLNAGWREKCVLCGTTYSPEHGQLVLSFLDALTVEIDLVGGKTQDEPVIEMPNRLFLAYGPAKWYETALALRYYDELKTLEYSNPVYAEGVDFAWYRTTRMLYPGNTNLTKVERLYDRFLVNEGRNLKGINGSGIKNGSYAAIKAFAACK